MSFIDDPDIDDSNSIFQTVVDELIYVNNKGKDENHKLIMKIYDQKVYKQALIKIANKCKMLYEKHLTDV
jgi:hypothetical protein